MGRGAGPVVGDSQVQGSSIALGEGACNQGTLHSICQARKEGSPGYGGPERGSRLQDLRKNTIILARKKRAQKIPGRAHNLQETLQGAAVSACIGGMVSTCTTSACACDDSTTYAEVK